MPTNFNEFTQGTSLSETDQIVGYTNTNAGGERRWQLGNLRTSLITGAATTIDTENLTVNRALVSDASGKVGASAVTSTEIAHLDGVTSSIQTQLNNKVPIGPAFRARPSGAFTIDGSQRKINLTDVFDTAGAFSPSTSQFKPSVSGYYLIQGLITVGGTAQGVRCVIYKNTDPYQFGSAGTDGGSSVHAIVYLNGGSDNVDFRAYAQSGTGPINTNVQYTNFEGFFIRPG